MCHLGLATNAIYKTDINIKLNMYLPVLANSQGSIKREKMSKPHVLAIPFPAQGHVIPLMEVVLHLANHGSKVTFINTDFTHELVMSSLSEKDNFRDIIHLISLPDGVEPWEDRNDLGVLSRALFAVMSRKFEELVEKMNAESHEKVTCVIADTSMGWALETAKKMGIKCASFWPPAAALMALQLRIPKLVDDRIINDDGTVTKDQMIQLSPTMPRMRTTNFVWACIGDSIVQRTIFELMTRSNELVKSAEYIICNSAFELEPAAFSLHPEILPIGPLLASNRLAKQAGYFWPEDSTCLTWLDQQPTSSVIYVAFGSFTIFDPTQFQELALGLELTNRPFLWVVRPDMTDGTSDVYPKGFKDRIGTRGQMVGWAPQQKVLAHPSVACFLSHCGWNSTLEGLSNGLPFLCWPYFADQFLNESYICDDWNTGLSFDKDEAGIVVREEIKSRVDQLLGDKSYKARAMCLEEKIATSIRKGGRSEKNFSNFIDWIKEKDVHAEN